MKLLNVVVGVVFNMCLLNTVFGQDFKFAHVTDTHIGNATGEEDLKRTVLDINANKEIEFVILSGDVTEFGSDEELANAKSILTLLNKPWYVIPGNHDTNWSESGANSFNRIFGYSRFYFKHKEYNFIGIGSGPNMRMGPGQIPREDIVWLDSTLKKIDKQEPIIYINHYPQDSSLNNWYSAIDLLKQKNIQLMLCGHGHINKLYNSENIPNVMGRSNLRAKDIVGGYNIVAITGGKAIYTERKPLTDVYKNWLEVDLKKHQFKNENKQYPRPNFNINQKYQNVNSKWVYQDDSDLGVGISIYKNKAITANTNGELYAINITKKGQLNWKFKTNGKIYSTPAVAQNLVVVGSSDNFIYCVSADKGKLKWKFETQKAVLGSPVIVGNKVLIGGSDGFFRAIDLKSGKLIWSFSDVKGFVVTKPLIHKGKVYFGSWGNQFYALDIQIGQKVWSWSNGATNRMFSPAACYPVVANNKVFIVAPDRYMTAINAETGEQIWRKTIPNNRVRESIGIAEDKSVVYAKTMDGKVFGVSTASNDFEITWNSELQLPYEIAPTAITTNKNKVFIPSNSGLATALDNKTGKIVWQYKSSNSLINTIQPYKKNKVLVSTMDGKITYLKF